MRPNGRVVAIAPQPWIRRARAGCSCSPGACALNRERDRGIANPAAYSMTLYRLPVRQADAAVTVRPRDRRALQSIGCRMTVA